MIIKSKLLSNTKKLISPPHFASKEKTRIARLLNTISLTLMFTSAIYFVFILLQAPIQTYQLFNVAVMFSMVLLTFILTRLEYVKQASIFISFALLVLTTGIITLTGAGISGPFTAVYILTLLTAGMLLEKIGGLVFSVLCLLALFGIYIMDISSYLPQSVVVHTKTSLWIMKSLIFIVAAVILNLALASINRAREALSKSEKRLNEAQKIAQIGSWELDLTTKTIICSDEVYNIFNLESQQFGSTYEALLDIIHPDDREFVNNAYTESIKNKTPYDIVHRLLLKDGTLKSVNERCETFYDDAGQAVRSMGTVQDITARKKAEDALRSSEKRFKIIFGAAPDAYYLNDLKGNFIDGNQAAVDLMGYTKEDLVGKSFLKLNILSTEGLLKASKALLKNAQGKGTGPDEFIVNRKDGSQVPVEILTYPVKIQDKTVVLGIARDITERKKSQKELMLSMKKYRDLYMHTPVMMHSIDKQGKLLSVSKKWLEVLGYDEQEVIGVKSTDFLTEVSKKYATEFILPAFFKNGYCYDIPYQFVKKGGEIIDVLLSAISEKDESGKVFRSLAVLEDVTERKKAERELNIAYKEIKDLKDKLQAENIYLRKTIEPSSLHKDIVGSSNQIKDLIEKALQVAPIDSNVLLLGETGTGKELIAKGIHDASRRKEKIMVTVNCAAIPDNLIESVLFGHEKGAFTDAQSKKIGLFEIADKSTIFLDEIGEMPYNVQSKLLRVLENREILRLGSNTPQKVDVRIIAATNHDLQLLVNEKKFRQDLYYRLNVFPIELPPLRTMKQDIKLLVEKFVNDFNNHMGRKVTSISKKTMKALEKYTWPGNVRELRNVVERSMIVSHGSALKLDMSQLNVQIDIEITTLKDYERSYIREILKMTFWKISGKGGAAEILGLKPNTLRSRMEKLGISRLK